MSPRYICIHGHFYQPPRENAWLEAIERQDSAYPYHDWNERVAAECYAPNAASRILDEAGRIAAIVNNYSLMSFNFGPTLLQWLEDEDPETYEAVLEADRASMHRFSGHGSALAQAYNHMILPLASEADKRTQVLWGIGDFQHRFGREPEGMWLPETAADLASLEALADAGIRFTILAPRQAARVRAPGGEWFDVRDDTLETRRPYRIVLPSGKEITAFFYDPLLARGVAFDRLLTDGAAFSRRLMQATEGFHDGAPPLTHIATDGETYGHHHSHGEMALSFALRAIEAESEVELTNYGEYLERHPATWEATIHEGSSWSCIHGVERWRSDCGCHNGRGKDWNQRWRKPLREAMDWLRNEVRPRFDWAAGELFHDPWAARDAYIGVLLDRSDGVLQDFLQRHARHPLEEEQLERALMLMELQRHALLMYTSCGWYFDDISGIETVQVLQYAGRVIELAERIFHFRGLEDGFLEKIEPALSNLPEMGNGSDVYNVAVTPARVDLRKAGAHFAVSSIYEEFPEESTIYSFRFLRSHEGRFETGKEHLLVGAVEVSSLVTREHEALSYAVLHLGNHNVTGGVRPFQGEEAYEAMAEGLSRPFLRTDFTAVIRLLDREFAAETYSLRSLFRDAQRQILEQILETSIEEAEQTLARLYEQRAPLLRFLADLSMPGPRPFRMAAEYILNVRLQRVLRQPDPKLQAIQAILEQVRSTGVELDAREVGFAATEALERLAERLEWDPKEAKHLRRLREMAELVLPPPVQAGAWRVQNVFYRVAREMSPEQKRSAKAGKESALEWVQEAERLGEVLSVAVPDGVGPTIP